MCTFDCHSGKCSMERDCMIKIPIKCVCKTLKKSFLCKEFKFEKDKIIEKTIKGEKKLFLHCNDKCEIKQKIVNSSNNVDSENSLAQKKSDQNALQNFSYFKYFAAAFLVLVVSIFIFILYA